MIPVAGVSRTVSVVLEDELLAINRAIGVLRRRDLAFDSISVGPGESEGLSRLTFVARSDDLTVERLVKQLEKTDGVRRVTNVPVDEAVAREFALIKIRPPHGRYAEMLDVVALFDATVVEEASEVTIVEVAGSSAFVTALIRAVEPFDVVEVARSGVITMGRAALSRPEYSAASSIE